MIFVNGITVFTAQKTCVWTSFFRSTRCRFFVLVRRDDLVPPVASHIKSDFVREDQKQRNARPASALVSIEYRFAGRTTHTYKTLFVRKRAGEEGLSISV